MLILMTVLTITMFITIVGKDIDECTVQDVCPDNSECKNNQGGFHCNCADGYQGDYCSDIDECNRTTSCHENAECLNTDGSYNCSCKDGFQFNNSSVCEDVDECEETKCDDQAECMNTIGSYICEDIFLTTATTNTTLALTTTKRPLPRSFR